MNLQQLVQYFYTLIEPDLPNAWEVEDAVAPLVNDPKAELILAQVPVIWPVSNSLCYNYLGLVREALACIRESDLPIWVNETLDYYESGGLRAAQQFMVDVKQNFVCHLQGQGGVRFSAVEGWLRPYLQGLAGYWIDLAPAAVASTNLETVYLPGELSLFNTEEENALLYKLLVSYQWSFIRIGSFFPEHPAGEEKHTDEYLLTFFHSFADPLLAIRLYHSLETLRAGFFLQKELPGLMRKTSNLRRALAPEILSPERESILHFLAISSCVLDDSAPPGSSLRYRNLIHRLAATEAGPEDSLALCTSWYDQISRESASHPIPPPLVFQGEMQLKAVYEVRARQRHVVQEEFIEAMATYLLSLPAARDMLSREQQESNGANGKKEMGVALIIEQAEGSPLDAPVTVHLTIDNASVSMPLELEQMARRLESEFAVHPNQFVASAVGKAGHHMARGEFVSVADEETITAPVAYDEWDYRRNGFRKNWCILSQQEIPLVRSNFVATTLGKYRGQIIRLRHQFEMMRNQERFLKRQRDGNDIDLDALVESLADSRAGLPPSDRLFIALKRDERDIATLFLIDMSNSTEGWVGTAIKESLVLLCEAMETLGDRYGIYGFSGMRRLRCETFHIKHIDEVYSEEVQQRIGAIAPREYTRMAPAIRHMSTLFEAIDARIRLLIILSDGKPEDYDEYKGEYAIEDTRHALLEAKSAGIHPFFITIDQHAHDYMGHMCGEANSVFIDDVRQLPARMPEVYRGLTS